MARAGSTGARPRWWAVLAVSLGLMALVASLTAGSRGTPRAGGPRGGGPDGHSARGAPAAGRAGGGGLGTTSSPAAGSTAAGRDVPGSQGGQPASPKPGEAATGLAQRSTAVPSTPGPSASTTSVPPTGPPTVTAPATTPTTTPTVTTTPSGAATSGTATPGTATSGTTTRSEVGNLTYPDNVSALYSFPDTGALEATASWAGGGELTLSIACPGRTATRTGPSSLSVSVAQGAADGGGTCTVSLGEPTSLRASLSYSLDVRAGQEIGD